MKPLPTLLLSALAASAVAGLSGVYRSSDGNLVLSYGSILFRQNPGGELRFDLSGGVDASSKTEGVRFRSAKAIVHLVERGKETVLRSIEGQGGVVITKTAAGRTTEVRGKQGTYDTAGATATARVTGAVRIVDTNSAKGQTMVATGSSGIASLKPGSRSAGSGLRSATLEGPVRIEVKQPANGRSKGGTVVATGNRMVVDNAGSTPTVTLRGNVKMKYPFGSGAGDLQDEVVVLRLNTQGEVTSFQAGGRR